MPENESPHLNGDSQQRCERSVRLLAVERSLRKNVAQRIWLSVMPIVRELTEGIRDNPVCVEQLCSLQEHLSKIADELSLPDFESSAPGVQGVVQSHQENRATELMRSQLDGSSESVAESIKSEWALRSRIAGRIHAELSGLLRRLGDRMQDNVAVREEVAALRSHLQRMEEDLYPRDVLHLGLIDALPNAAGACKIRIERPNRQALPKLASAVHLQLFLIVKLVIAAMGELFQPDRIEIIVRTEGSTLTLFLTPVPITDNYGISTLSSTQIWNEVTVRSEFIHAEIEWVVDSATEKAGIVINFNEGGKDEQSVANSCTADFSDR